MEQELWSVTCCPSEIQRLVFGGWFVCLIHWQWVWWWQAFRSPTDWFRLPIQ